MLAYLKLIRPKQWTKNLFILVPVFFAGKLFNSLGFYKELALGFVSFSLVASSIYIFNDYLDRESDRLHPKKRFRPLASGDANVTISFIIMALFLIISFSIAYYLSLNFLFLLLTYFTINTAYTLGLKNISILDIFILSSGFIMRIYAGGILGEVPISHWLVLMIMLLALFLALAKRRDDLVISQGGGEVIRKSSRSYNLEFINSCLSIFSGIIIVSYIMYSVSPEVIERLGTDWLFTTTIFVIAGVMRYLQITIVEQNSGSPSDILLRDKFLIGTIIGWIVSFYLIIYII